MVLRTLYRAMPYAAGTPMSSASSVAPTPTSMLLTMIGAKFWTPKTVS